jgi:hypothetical protein
MSTPDNEPYRWLGRLLEMVPGLISWAILILPLWLSFSYPWLVAYFVLSFDFYWLCRALWFSGAVIVAYRRIRRVLAVDWSERVAALSDPGGRIAQLEGATTVQREAGARGRHAVDGDGSAPAPPRARGAPRRDGRGSTSVGR